MTWYGLRNLYQTAICAYTWHQENQRLVILLKYPTPLQEPIYKLVIQEEPIDSMISDMLNLIDVPNEVLFPDYVLESWVWINLNDAKLSHTNSYCNVNKISIINFYQLPDIHSYCNTCQPSDDNNYNIYQFNIILLTTRHW